MTYEFGTFGEFVNATNSDEFPKGADEYVPEKVHKKELVTRMGNAIGPIGVEMVLLAKGQTRLRCS